MKNTELKLDTIPEALEELKNGNIIIVVDDENRENEGDFIGAASEMTTETINFMTKYGRGLVCAPLTAKRAEELDLDFMVGKNTDPKQTAFTVSVDLLGHGVTTGISASDRAKTLQALANVNSVPQDFSRPGHIFPLIAKKGGVLKRDGHTEASIDLLQLAGLPQVGVLIEIMNEDGTMARIPELIEVAKKFNLKMISIKDLIAYRLKNDSLIERIKETEIDTSYGKLKLIAYKDKTNDQIHFALIKGEIINNEAVPVRVNSTNAYFDLFKNLAYGESSVFEKTMEVLNKEEKGIFVFINKPLEDKTIENYWEEIKSFISNKINFNPLDTDKRDLGIGAQIIKDLGINKIKLITQTKGKSLPLSDGYGIEIVNEITI